MATGTALSPQLLRSADQRLPAAVVGVRSNDHGVEFRSLLTWSGWSGDLHAKTSDET